MYSFASIVFSCFELLYVFPFFEKPRLFWRLKYYSLLKLLFSAALLMVPFLWYRKLVPAAKAEDDRDLQLAFLPLLVYDLLCAYFGYCHYLLVKSETSYGEVPLETQTAVFARRSVATVIDHRHPLRFEVRNYCIGVPVPLTAVGMPPRPDSAETPARWRLDTQRMSEQGKGLASNSGRNLLGEKYLRSLANRLGTLQSWPKAERRT